MWTEKVIGNYNSLSAILKFRISGQAKTFFGDGIALWITSEPYREGDFHGTKENFYGIAVIMDTFKNIEYAHAHRDVTVLVNDGEKTYEMMTDDIVGCDVDVRYHNARADFSVTDASRVYLNINSDNSLKVEIDARNNNNWIDCIQIDKLPLLSHDWLSKAHIGITASTGSLADNHDVLSLHTFTTSQEAEGEKLRREVLTGYAIPPLDSKDGETGSASASASGSGSRGIRGEEITSKMTNEERLEAIESRLAAGLQRFAEFDLHLDHELASVSEHVEHMIKQIEGRENKAESRLEEIEELMREQMYDGQAGHQWYALEEAMEAKLQLHMDTSLNSMHESLGELQDHANKATSGWRTPMYVLLFIVVVGFGWMYYEYKKRMKWGHLG